MVPYTVPFVVPPPEEKGYLWMTRCEKLFQKAKNSPSNLRFEELCALAKCYGWMFKRQRGTSHQVWENPKLTTEQGRRKTFQSIKGKAAEYQVKDLLDSIEGLA